MDDRIEAVLENFDFDSVHRAMCALGWAWYGSDAVPTQYELIRRARQMLYELKERGEERISTGGFIAERFGDDYSLLFYVDNENSFDLLGPDE